MDTKRTELTYRITQLDIHDHLCHIYRSQEEQFDTIIPFIKTGLERNEKCFYIAGDNTCQTVLTAMHARGIDTDAAIKSGVLTIANKQEACLRHGVFDPDAMIKYFDEIITSAKDSGFSAVRATSEMTWALGDEPGVERLIEYEAKLSHFFPRKDIIAMCQYNYNRFTPDVIMDVIRTHPLIIHGGMVCVNPYYAPPDEFSNASYLHQEIRRWLENLMEYEHITIGSQNKEQQLMIKHLLEEVCKYKKTVENLQHTAESLKACMDHSTKALVCGNEKISKLTIAVEKSPNSVLIADFMGHIEYVNAGFSRVTGYASKEAIGKNHRTISFGGWADDTYRIVWETILSGREWRGEFQDKNVKSDELYWVSVTISPVKNAEGLITHYICIQEDITGRKRLTEMLEASEERFRDMVNKNKDGLVVVNREGLVIYANPATLSLFKTNEDAFISKPFGFPVVHGERTEIDIYRKKDERCLAEMRVVGTRWRDEDAYIIALTDITERKNAERKIQQLAYYDTLTGLPNRMLFSDRLSLAIAQAERSGELLAVMFLDLDRFKDVNNTLGHNAGDRLLKTIAGRLVNCLRKMDTVTRQGGDEFTLILSALSCADDAAIIAAQIIETVKQPIPLDGHPITITTSIGIAFYPTDGKDAETLLKHADAAMYQAKEEGRDTYRYYTQKLHVRLKEQRDLGRELRRALDNQEFTVFYQPQVEMATGSIVCVEALVRWQHPEKGIIDPDVFIPMAERLGLIVPLGEMVLHMACLQGKKWHDAGLSSFRVAVNLSRRQFEQKNLIETLEWILRETGMKSKSLVLEITESTAMKDVETAADAMKKLAAMGISIAMDDLGTGYSSLSCLKTFPIHALKIDRSFIRNIITDRNDAAIVTAIIAMAKSMGLRVVAEGVETQEQFDMLKQLQCDEIQGYLYSKPLPADEMEKMLVLLMQNKGQQV